MAKAGDSFGCVGGGETIAGHIASQRDSFEKKQ